METRRICSKVRGISMETRGITLKVRGINAETRGVNQGNARLTVKITTGIL